MKFPNLPRDDRMWSEMNLSFNSFDNMLHDVPSTVSDVPALQMDLGSQVKEDQN